LGFHLVATAGTARELREAGLEVDQVAKVAEGSEATVVDLIRRGKCDLVVNTPYGGSLQRTDGYRIREAALVARVPCITTNLRGRGRRARDRQRPYGACAQPAGTHRCREDSR
jgi:carbamoyl-phosphate synthase large subunit